MKLVNKITLLGIIGLSCILSFIGFLMSPNTPMEYAKENNLIFNGTHYISNEKTDGFNRVCLKSPHFKTMPTSCKWIKFEETDKEKMEYTKEDIIKKLKANGFSDIVKYDSEGRVTNYQLELAINKTFK